VASIWIVKQYGSTPELPGGTRQFDLAQSLARRGYEVTYFLSSFHYLLQEEVKLRASESFRVERQNGFNLVWVRGFPYKRNDWRRVVNMVDYAKRFYLLGKKITRQQPDINSPNIVIAFNLPLLTPLCSYLLSKKYGAKFFLEVGDLWPQTLIDMGVLDEQSLIASFLRSIEKFLYRRAQRILTPLPYISEYPSLDKFKNKIIRIGTGIDLSNYRNSAKIPDKKNEGFKLLYLGAHGPANDLSNVLNAFARIQDLGFSEIKLILVGHGVAKDELVREAQDMQLRNLGFENAIPKNKVPEIIATADACLFSLKKASVFSYGINPNKLADYLGSGKPIVFAADVRNNIVKETGCGLAVRPGEPEELADAIIKLYRMPPKDRVTMGYRGRKYAEKYLDFEKVADNLVEILDL
jgi:glycosyltransferase involved in cell wall biosynthesis